MSKPLPLRTRLLFSHLIVMAVAIIALAAVSRLYTPRYFVIRLERLEGRGVRVQHIRGQLLEGFTDAWRRGMLWSIVLGGGAAGGISYLLSRRIIRPLTRMEAATQQFAAGDWTARVPPLDIPELNQLGNSFNRMASDLEGVEQRRRELVSDLTHELRTPLTIVKGYLEGLSDGTLSASPETYNRLVRETTRLQRLVEDLQELSKLEAGYLPIHQQRLALGRLIEQVVRRFRDQLSEADKRELIVSIPAGLPPVQADPARVEQILVNLLSNALRYTPAGEISVTAWAATPYVWVAIADSGIGIAPADLPHVFERFWRADRSRNRDSGGTGIGLAICKRLVELQGGSIKVDSKLEEGSVFSFSLPQFLEA
ncbi:MAG: HAMP domain-containing histidine kinase [Leptolyngbya sp. SIO4C1]|nr:HAMP domain-containing histidine kinase [Leptolyngbya sp. SIO4C1]